MSNSITVEMSTDVHFDDIAEQVVSDSTEADLLVEIRNELMRTFEQSEDAAEQSYLAEAASRFGALAEWMEKNEP